jgi:hypothetical protein
MEVLRKEIERAQLADDRDRDLRSLRRTNLREGTTSSPPSLSSESTLTPALSDSDTLDDEPQPKTQMTTKTEDRLFRGDYSAGEKPHMWLRRLESKFDEDTKITTKMFRFAKNLEPGQPAEIWFKSLTAADQTSWDIFYQVFSTRWPLPAAIVTSREELMGKLRQTRLEEADVGAIIERDGDRVYAHVVWTEEIRSIIDELKNTDGHLVTMVRQNLPLSICLSLPAKLDTWPTFLAAIASVSLDTIADRREHEEAIRHDILQTMGMNTNNSQSYNVNALATKFASTALYSPNRPTPSYSVPAKATVPQTNPVAQTPSTPNAQRQSYAPYSSRQGYTPAQQWTPRTPVTLTNQRTGSLLNTPSGAFLSNPTILHPGSIFNTSRLQPQTGHSQSFPARI